MMNRNSYDRAPAAYEAYDGALTQTNFINRVYGWMTVGLAVTACFALLVGSNEALLRATLGKPMVYFLLCLAEIGLVVWLSAAFQRLSTAAATLMFLVFSALNGVTLSAILLVYEPRSIAATFFITSGTFGVMSLYGYLTKKDLTTIGNLAFMGLIGIIIASLVNWFLQSSALMTIINYLGVLIYIGLTAYYTQKIKQLSIGVGEGAIEAETGRKLAIYGALELYLDFINLFLMLLRLFGNRR